MSRPRPTALLLGPLLRHVDPVSATVWVETDRPCEVEVLGRRASARSASAATTTRWSWSRSSSRAARRRTRCSWTATGVAAARVRSSRQPDPHPGTGRRTFRPPSAPAAGADHAEHSEGSRRTRSTPTPAGWPAAAADQWPDALVLLGDQVYADELTKETTPPLHRRRRHPRRAPADEVADFEEYTRLYLESWADPQVRWLLSTVPSSMIFDDHEIIDDWNTSAAWRAEIGHEPWWRERIRAAWSLLGLPAPGQPQPRRAGREQDLAGDPLAERTTPSRCCDEFARGRPRPARIRWSYRRDWATPAVIMIDNRAGQELEGGRRHGRRRRVRLDRGAGRRGRRRRTTWSSAPRCRGCCRTAIHNLERHQRDAGRGRPGGGAGSAEKVRQAADLEHWAAFGESFERLGRR